MSEWVSLLCGFGRLLWRKKNKNRKKSVALIFPTYGERRKKKKRHVSIASFSVSLHFLNGSFLVELKLKLKSESELESELEFKFNDESRLI